MRKRLFRLFGILLPDFSVNFAHKYITDNLYVLFHRENGTVKFLTKGDNNSVDDRGLYAPGQLWLTKNDIVGRARGVLPYVGMITIYMNEYPNFKVSRSIIYVL